MKNLALILLFLLGIAEIVVGSIFGRLMIYAHEVPFGRAIGLTPDRYKAFNYYIRLFKDQWNLVTLFGFVTILLAAVLIYISRKE